MIPLISEAIKRQGPAKGNRRRRKARGDFIFSTKEENRSCPCKRQLWMPLPAFPIGLLEGAVRGEVWGRSAKWRCRRNQANRPREPVRPGAPPAEISPARFSPLEEKKNGPPPPEGRSDPWYHLALRRKNAASQRGNVRETSELLLLHPLPSRATFCPRISQAAFQPTGRYL